MGLDYFCDIHNVVHQPEYAAAKIEKSQIAGGK
jgi:hypothetical protein